MKARAEKSSSPTSRTATQVAPQPFFAKAGGGTFFAASVQAKLMVGKAGDPFEKEADAVAGQVVNRVEAAPVRQNNRAGSEEKDQLRGQPLAESITPFVQRQSEEPAGEAEDKEEVQTKSLQRQAEEQKPVQAKLRKREEKEEPPVQAKRAEPAVPILNPAAKSRLSETKGQGSPLPESARAFMEAGFGIDFGHVRIHTGGIAVELCNDLHAQAFTHGSDIYFNEGRYNPTSTDAQKLLAHELTHVVQQNRSKGVPPKPANRKLVGKNTLEPVEPVSAPVPPSSRPAAAPLVPDASTAAPVVPPAVPPARTPAAPLEQKETAAGLPGEKAAPGMEQSAIEPAKSPAKPEEDPDFKEAKKAIRKDVRRQKSHEPAGKKQAEMKAAAALMESEQREQSGQEQQAAALEEAAKPKKRFNRVSFKEKLKAKIEEKLPETEDEAKEFPSSGKLDEAKSEFGQTVSEEKGQLTDPLKKTAEGPPPPGQVAKLGTPVPAAKPAGKPSKIPSPLVAPKPRTDREISLQHESDNLDKRLAQENITERQLAESEEPQFEQALKKKQDAQREIAAAPGRYREQESRVLEQARQQAGVTTGRELHRMASVKNKSLGSVGVYGSQKQKESQTEIRQREIKRTINDIYLRTERDVKIILENLSLAVQTKFNVQAQMANMLFNMAVRSRLDDHYGWFTFDDKIAEAVGLSDGVAHIFREEKQNFLNKMDKVLDDIATTVETELNQALDRIQQGRKELENFKKTLSVDEQKYADDLIKEVDDKFTDLEAAVEEQQEELLETLSDQYVENVNKLQEEFDKINEELGSSWIADAISFIGDVATAIRRLGALLMSIVDRIADQVDAILAAPKRFFANLVSGINQGIDKFTSNIGTYLEQGFWMWLTGASSARNIQVPEKMDPQGMFSLALQMVGIDKLFFLERIRVKLGKGVEKLITGAQAAGEKLLEPVRILLDGGVGALWAWVKEEVSSHLQKIFTKIKEEIFEAIIKKALLWVGSLFVPGLGFIRLVQAIYKALRWLVDNITRIVDIVNSFLDSVALAVQGNVGGIVNKVIKGLTLGVVIAIDFLAKLVGLGNFADKLQRAIRSLKKPIQKGLDWLLTKARPVVRKIERALRKAVAGGKKAGAKVKAGVAAVFQWWKNKKPFTTTTGKKHNLLFIGEKQAAKLVVRTVETDVPDLLRKNGPFHKSVETSGTKAQKASYTAAVGHTNTILASKARLSKNANDADAAKELNVAFLQLADDLIVLWVSTQAKADLPKTVPRYDVDSTGKPVHVVAEPLTSKGTKSSAVPQKNILGWTNIPAADSRNWERTHVLSAALFGSNKQQNLIAARRSTNAWFREGPEEAGKKFISGKAVTYYEARIAYHSPPPPQVVDFPARINLTIGTMKKNGDTWKRDQILLAYPTQTLSPPNFAAGAGAIPNLRFAGHPALYHMGKIPIRLAMVISRNRPSEGYASLAALMKVLKDHYAVRDKSSPHATSYKQTINEAIKNKTIEFV
jgi:hypothetical protein